LLEFANKNVPEQERKQIGRFLCVTDASNSAAAQSKRESPAGRVRSHPRFFSHTESHAARHASCATSGVRDTARDARFWNGVGFCCDYEPDAPL